MPEALSSHLYSQWMDYNAELVQKVFSQEMCDIEPDFMGFVEQYYYLSKIIPEHWTILDLDCAYAPQCWYFKDHKKYIGVDLEVVERFNLPNCDHYMSSIWDWFEELMPNDLNIEQTFGIMCYVPADENSYLVVKNILPNLFVYYPSVSLSDRPSRGGWTLSSPRYTP